MALSNAEKARIAALEQSVTDLTEDRDTLRAQLQHEINQGTATHQALVAQEQENAELRETNRSITLELEEANADVASLNQLLTAAPAPAAPVQNLVASNGRQYQLNVARFNLAGEEYSADDVTSGSLLLDQLVAISAGILADVTPEEQPAE